MDTPQPPDREGELLVAARHDLEAFAELFELTWPWLLRRLTPLTWCPETAADLASETMARAVLYHQRFEPEQSSGQAWLWGIARNVLRRWYRTGQTEQRAARRLAFEPMVPDAALDRLADRSSQALMHDALSAALATLTAVERDVVQRKVLEQLSFAELARLQGCAVTEVQKRYSRAIAKLRRALPRVEALT
jgi:RNA polymerase sigma factor (sigma-70 family)